MLQIDAKPLPTKVRERSHMLIFEAGQQSLEEIMNTHRQTPQFRTVRNLKSGN
jgi:hypothetical protein